MTKAAAVTTLALTLFTATSAYAIDGWNCMERECYVTKVKFTKGKSENAYVEAWIKNLGGGDNTKCTSIAMKVQDAVTIDDVRAFESIVLTALTTGMKIEFQSYGSGTGACTVFQTRVAKP